MIYSAVKFVKEELNRFLSQATNSEPDLVVLGNIRELDGPDSETITDKIVISLVNVEHLDEAGKPHVAYRKTGTQQVQNPTQPPLNLYLLISSNIIGYEKALSHLSMASTFIQEYGERMNRSSTTPPEGIELLEIQLENLTILELGNLWGMLGGKHVPSLLCRLRVVAL